MSCTGEGNGEGEQALLLEVSKAISLMHQAKWQKLMTKQPKTDEIVEATRKVSALEQLLESLGREVSEGFGISGLMSTRLTVMLLEVQNLMLLIDSNDPSPVKSFTEHGAALSKLRYNLANTKLTGRPVRPELVEAEVKNVMKDGTEMPALKKVEEGSTIKCMQGQTRDDRNCGKTMSTFHALKVHCEKFHADQPEFYKKDNKLHAKGPYEEMSCGGGGKNMVICRMPKCDGKLIPTKEFNRHCTMVHHEDGSN